MIRMGKGAEIEMEMKVKRGGRNGRGEWIYQDYLLAWICVSLHEYAVGLSMRFRFWMDGWMDGIIISIIEDLFHHPIYSYLIS